MNFIKPSPRLLGAVRFLLLALLAFAPDSRAATARVNVTFSWDDAASQGPTTGIKIEPVTPPWAEGGSVVIGDPITRASKTSPVVVTNLFGSDNTNTAIYRVTISSKVQTPYYIKVWLTNAVAGDLIVAAPGQSAGWAAGIFIPRDRGTGISNSFTVPRLFSTPGGTNPPGTSNYVWTLTNELTGQAEWRAGGSGGGGSGEVTTAQLLVVSNQTQVASNAFRTDISNLQGATNGLASRITTIENSTNSFAKLAAVVELTNVVNTASNRTWSADNWGTNRVNAGLTNDHSVAVSLKTNLSVSGSNMVRALVVTNNAEIGGNLTAVGFTNTGNTLLTMDFRLSSSDFTGTDTFIGRSGATAKIISKPLYQDLTSSNLAGIHNATSAGTNFARVFEGTSDTDESALSVSNGYIRGRLNARDITQTNITADRVAVFNSSKNLTNSPGVTTTELEYLDGVTSGIQAQIDGSSNKVRVAAGANVTVTPSGSGGVMTFTVASSGGSGSSSFNSTNLYVSNSTVVVADLANFDRLKVYAISNGTIHLSNAASFLKRGRALIQQSTNGLASIAWSVPGGVLQTNVNIGNNTNANALDVLEFEQSFFETNLFAWWPSNFLPRVAFTNSLASSGGGSGGASFSDTFNRTDETPLAGNWETGLGSHIAAELSLNRVGANGGNWVARVKTATAAFDGTQWAQVVLISGLIDFVGPVVLCDASGNGYAAAYAGGGACKIYEMTSAGSFTQVGTDITGTFVAGDQIKLQSNGGGVLELFQNGVSLGTRTDASSPLTTGQPGVWGGSGLSVDDFSAAD